MTTLLLTSGGMDSFIIWKLLGEPAQAYVLLGHRYQEQERSALSQLHDLYPTYTYKEIRTIDLSSYEQPDGFIPLRNMLLIACAALTDTGVDTILLGALAGEASIDKSGKFLRDLSRLLSFTLGRRIRAVAPYRHLTKTQLVSAYLASLQHSDAESRYKARLALGLTVSCYTPGPMPCGECQACFRRWVAMSNNGLEERYAVNPLLRAAEFDPTWSNLLHWRDLLGTSSWRELRPIIKNNLEAKRAIANARLLHP